MPQGGSGHNVTHQGLLLQDLSHFHDGSGVANVAPYCRAVAAILRLSGTGQYNTDNLVKAFMRHIMCD
jgi:hypothetical protein